MRYFIPVLIPLALLPAAYGQLTDYTQAPNLAGAGIAKSLTDQIGAGRGTIQTPNSSAFIIGRDPFRSIRRGRQLFQRKFTRVQGVGPITGDGIGDINTIRGIGAGLADSCAACHGRPRGTAGAGGVVVTRPDSRDAPHLFGLGLKEMLADEITADLRRIRQAALQQAKQTGRAAKARLGGKGIEFGSLTAKPDGGVDTSEVRGVNPDLRVRPFFAHGETISIREFVVGALKAEMGLEAVDPDLAKAGSGQRVVTPTGMVLDGSLDKIEVPVAKNSSEDPDRDGLANEIPESAVDHLEFYLLNYFKAGTYRQTNQTRMGERILQRIGCTSCHVQDLRIEKDRRVADVETVYDPANAGFNNLFSTAAPLFNERNDGSGLPSMKTPKLQPFVVRNIFTDFRRHDLGPNFWERNYDGTLQKEFLTTALWGVGTTAPSKTAPPRRVSPVRVKVEFSRSAP